MSARGAARLAWSLWLLTVALVALGVLFWAFNRPSTGAYSPYLLNLSAAALPFSTVGAIVASRRRENPIGWLFCTSGLLLGITAFAGEYGTYAAGSLSGESLALWLAYWLYVPAIALVSFSFLLFPDGRLPSPRWRPVAWIAAASILLEAIPLALEPGSFFENGTGQLPPMVNPFGVQDSWLLTAIEVAAAPLFLASALAPVLALFVRLRRSSGEERQQIKWVAYAGAILAAAITFVSIWPALDGSPVGTALFLAGFLAIPSAIGIAILKHRLYDIDIIINRTLVYGTLTAMLILVYLGGVVVLQYLFRALTGSESQLAIVVSTLAIAALFHPLRHRIQGFIDRRFYRSKYDAARTLEAFSSRLRDETDVGVLSDDLVGVIRETVQPAHASLWLRRPEEKISPKKLP